SDSMHVTNTVPQMQPFNAGIWLGLENYALENAREDDMKICVFTGPFLRDDDPERYGVRVPIEFWKVIAFIHDDTGKLCATACRRPRRPAGGSRSSRRTAGRAERPSRSASWTVSRRCGTA